MKHKFSTLGLSMVWIAVLSLPGCTSTTSMETVERSAPGSYAYDLDLLKANTKKVIELYDSANGAYVLLSADYQGRVMTSSATGREGDSFGWLNYKLISSDNKLKQFNPVGGEERFWLGPEGGQFALYFAPGDSFSIHKWQVPSVIDTVEYSVDEAAPEQATFSARASLVNYSGTSFDIDIHRKVTLVSRQSLATQLGVNIPNEIPLVAYRSSNTITNAGATPWKKESGLLSIWLLGMFTPSDQTAVIIPFHPLDDRERFITTDYFGAIPSDRLIVNDSALYFRCDGKYRSKIGLSPIIAKPYAASYDFQKNVLSLIRFTVDKQGDYVNSTWKQQDFPYKGDVVNSYNDGPLANGDQLGPFYELESSSSVKELKPGESIVYEQTTCHLQGDYAAMQQLVQNILGVNLDDVRRAMFASKN